VTANPDGDDPLAVLAARELFGIKLGLENIAALCETLDHPQLAYPTVIVGGTNGKGSVTAMASTALSSAGHRTARYTSPHLVRLEERFTMDARPVDTEQLRRATALVLEAEASARRAGRMAPPATFFELTTAVAFVLFREMKADVAVLEVGLGGRFDATNVASPMAGAITNIDLDHTSQLGGTIKEIAFEKAGIIKPGMTVVTGERKPEAWQVLKRVAAERGASLVAAFEGVQRGVDLVDGLTSIDLSTPDRRYGRIQLGLRGRHQADNAVVAVRLLEVIGKEGISLTPEAIVDGLTTTRWPGRLEVLTVQGGRRVLLDAAHNPAGAATLASYLGEIWPSGVPIVFGVMRDKDAASMLRVLAPRATRFVFTQARMARALPCGEISALGASVGIDVPTEVTSSSEQAIALALRNAQAIAVCGSIYLIGEVLQHLEAMRTAAPGGAR
jgi:dihydrofolate synthase/folylpolyglutamate synthase